MVKRILTIALGVVLGSCVAMSVAKLAFLWGLFADKDLDRSTEYVREVLQLVKENYVEENDAHYTALTHAAIHGIAGSLDPHTEFMEAKDYQQLQEDISSQFGGVGIQIELRKGRVVIVAPIAGGPSERAGIQRGDEITKIDGEQLEKATMDSVIGRLRGKPKTRVKLSLRRPSTKNDFEVTIVREMIKTESVRDVAVLADGIGYLQITQFTERTGDEFIKAINKLSDLKANALVIDLRNNPGGLLDAAVAVAEPFFKKGDIIVYTQGRKPGDREDYKAEADDPPLEVPVAVLINAGSASAAEIVAGALKDTGKAVIVGERSFGKGSVQSIFKLKNGEGMRLTTARYYTPSGVTIHEKGVSPHVEVVMTPEDDQNVRLQRARRDMTNPAEFKERFGFAPIDDRQLQTALDVLHGILILDTRKNEPATVAPVKK
ncbi:MAG: S41 family peptidase [Verrucomicrobia bacterium]|nr:S41 family peptidase [Verrucomicrobiota bacterium]